MHQGRRGTGTRWRRGSERAGSGTAHRPCKFDITQGQIGQIGAKLCPTEPRGIDVHIGRPQSLMPLLLPPSSPSAGSRLRGAAQESPGDCRREERRIIREDETIRQERGERSGETQGLHTYVTLKSMHVYLTVWPTEWTFVLYNFRKIY
jgi:hypothetical protein